MQTSSDVVRAEQKKRGKIYVTTTAPSKTESGRGTGDEEEILFVISDNTRIRRTRMRAFIMSWNIGGSRKRGDDSYVLACALDGQPQKGSVY